MPNHRFPEHRAPKPVLEIIEPHVRRALDKLPRDVLDSAGRELVLLEMAERVWAEAKERMGR